MVVSQIKPHVTENAADPLLISYLDAVVLLTSQRDAQGLSASLINSLCQHVQAERFRLLAISNTARDAEFGESNVQGAFVRDWLNPMAIPVPIAEDADFLACVRTGGRVSRTPPGAATRRLVLPIFGASSVSALLVIEGMRKLSGEEEVLARLLQIFSNHAYLLSRNEQDGLTGLYNRQAFDTRIKQLVLNAGYQDRRANSPEEGKQNCLALLDVDFFKQVNDKFGHLYGDEVLVQFARLMNRAFRHEDLLFRYGGEEFAVVLVGSTLDDAMCLLERLRQTMAVHQFPQIGCKTVSIGVAGIQPGESVDTIINRADQALYYAKHNGRNRACCYERLVAQGKLEPVTVATGDIELF